MDSPTNTPREDSPASGPSPEVQVPGKNLRFEVLPVEFEVQGWPRLLSHSVEYGDAPGTFVHVLRYLEGASS